MNLKPEEVIHYYFNMLAEHPDYQQTVIKNFEKYYFQLRPRLQMAELHAVLFGGSDGNNQQTSGVASKHLLIYQMNSPPCGLFVLMATTKADGTPSMVATSSAQLVSKMLNF